MLKVGYMKMSRFWSKITHFYDTFQGIGDILVSRSLKIGILLKKLIWLILHLFALRRSIEAKSMQNKS